MSIQSNVLMPWYRQFWPWFIIALPASVIAASLVMVVIAFNGADTLVNDSYYKKGLTINQTLQQDKRARELGLKAKVHFDQKSGEVAVALTGQVAAMDNLQLLLLHPVDASRDLAVRLLLTDASADSGHYRADLDRRLANRYYLRLLPTGDNASWRLGGELNFEYSQQVILTPDD